MARTPSTQTHTHTHTQTHTHTHTHNRLGAFSDDNLHGHKHVQTQRKHKSTVTDPAGFLCLGGKERSDCESALLRNSLPCYTTELCRLKSEHDVLGSPTYLQQRSFYWTSPTALAPLLRCLSGPTLSGSGLSLAQDQTHKSPCIGLQTVAPGASYAAQMITNPYQGRQSHKTCD